MNVVNAVNGVQEKFKVGDKVKIFYVKYTYPNMTSWFRFSRNNELKENWRKDMMPISNKEYTIAAIHPHEVLHGEIVCAIKDENNNIFLIEQNGLIKIKERKKENNSVNASNQTREKKGRQSKPNNHTFIYAKNFR